MGTLEAVPQAPWLTQCRMKMMMEHQSLDHTRMLRLYLLSPLRGSFYARPIPGVRFAHPRLISARPSGASSSDYCASCSLPARPRSAGHDLDSIAGSGAYSAPETRQRLALGELASPGETVRRRGASGASSRDYCTSCSLPARPRSPRHDLDSIAGSPAHSAPEARQRLAPGELASPELTVRRQRALEGRKKCLHGTAVMNYANGFLRNRDRRSGMRSDGVQFVTNNSHSRTSGPGRE